MRDRDTKYDFPARIGQKRAWTEADDLARLRLANRIRSAASRIGKALGRTYSVRMRGAEITVRRDA